MAVEDCDWSWFSSGELNLHIFPSGFINSTIYWCYWNHFYSDKTSHNKHVKKCSNCVIIKQYQQFGVEWASPIQSSLTILAISDTFWVCFRCRFWDFCVFFVCLFFNKTLLFFLSVYYHEYNIWCVLQTSDCTEYWGRFAAALPALTFL